jgi:hypothetical protein
MVVRPGRAPLSPREIDDVLAFDWLDVYQVVQPDTDRLQARLVINERYEAGSERDVREALERLLGSGFDVSVERVDSIGGERSGKLLACISRVSSAAESTASDVLAG